MQLKLLNVCSGWLAAVPLTVERVATADMGSILPDEFRRPAPINICDYFLACSHLPQRLLSKIATPQGSIVEAVCLPVRRSVPLVSSAGIFCFSRE